MPEKTVYFIKHFLPVIIIFCMTDLSCFKNADADSKNIRTSAVKTKSISWHRPVKEKNRTVIPGSVMTDSGILEFRWVLDRKGMPALSTLKLPSSTELSPEESRILPLFLSDGSAILFLERHPLLDRPGPSLIVNTVIVTAEDLLSVLSGDRRVQSYPPLGNAEIVTWGKVFVKNDVFYLQGNTKNSSGSVNLHWKKKNAENAELVLVERPGAGELPPVEIMLYIWINEKTGTAVICRENFPLIGRGTISSLAVMAVVKLNDLINGFMTINRAP
jgi:hypothetical protein